MFASPLLGLSGAIEAEGMGVASHYGHPLGESRALEEGRAIVDVSNEGVIRVTGSDRLSWLNSMTSQELQNLKPGASTETLLLTPQGRIQHYAGVVDDGASTWLFVNADAAPDFAAYLNRMKFMMRVEVTDESADYGQIVTFAPEIAERIKSQIEVTAVWSDPWQDLLPGGFQYAQANSHEWRAIHLLIKRELLTEVARMVRAKEFSVAGRNALEALSIRAWRPTLAEVDERAIPHELDWMRTAVHLNKGCYRGQETVAKVHNLGRPPRRLVMLHLEGADAEMPAPGALIHSQDDPERPVGRVTRVALHHDWGAIALALLKRNTPVDAELTVVLPSGGACAAVQEVIVPPEAGATRNVPRLPRLG